MAVKAQSSYALGSPEQLGLHPGLVVHLERTRTPLAHSVATAAPVIPPLPEPVGMDPVEELRAAFQRRQGLDPHFVVLEHGHHQIQAEPRFVIIRRGRRHHGRNESVDLVTLDGDVMRRDLFLKAVAMAAGRLHEEKDTILVKAGVTPPTREEALLEGSLILVAEDNEINQKEKTSWT